MLSLPAIKNAHPLLKTIYSLRAWLWNLRMKVPARYAVHAIVLVVAIAVAYQNITSTSLAFAFKSSDRLSRYFDVRTGDNELITEGLESLPKAVGGNYLQAGIDLPNLALATGDLETLNLITADHDIAVTDTTALSKPSMVLTTIAERPREEVLSYTVQSGDTVSTIAENFGLQPRTILWANGLSDSSIIKPGAQIKILPLDGVTHKVADGDTLQAIAKKYQASLDKIVSFNTLSNENAIKEGQELIIPGGVRPAAPRPKSSGVKLAASNGSSFAPVSESSGDTSSTGSFGWPIGCRTVTQYFGWHTGIDVACPFGTELFAADGGTVVFAGWNGGYGNSVVVDHGNGFQTRYAHIKEGGIAVRNGQAVSRGQVVGYEGSTGWSTGPHIHFEIMKNGSFQNPLNYL
jgi:LysM repeat protein